MLAFCHEESARRALVLGLRWVCAASKAHDLVDEMFHSEVITEIIKEQDTPGAINIRPESSNSEVAD